MRDDAVTMDHSSTRSNGMEVHRPYASESILGRLPVAKGVRKSSVVIRLPEDKDWDDIKNLVRRHHQRTIFADIPFSEAKLDRLVEKVRRSASNECLVVAEAKGQLVGLAWFSAGEYMIGEGALMTTVHLLAVDARSCGPYLSARIFLRLLRSVRLWSDSAKAKHVLVHVTTGTAIKSTDRLLRSAGAKLMGGVYLFAQLVKA